MHLIFLNVEGSGLSHIHERERAREREKERAREGKLIIIIIFNSFSLIIHPIPRIYIPYLNLSI